jgi:hypothetical protein
VIGYCKDCAGWLRDADDAAHGTAGLVIRARCAMWESKSFGCLVAAAHFCDAFRVMHNPAFTGQTTGYAAHTGADEVRQA